MKELQREGVCTLLHRRSTDRVLCYVWGLMVLRFPVWFVVWFVGVFVGMFVCVCFLLLWTTLYGLCRRCVRTESPFSLSCKTKQVFLTISKGMFLRPHTFTKTSKELHTKTVRRRLFGTSQRLYNNQRAHIESHQRKFLCQKEHHFIRVVCVFVCLCVCVYLCAQVCLCAVLWRFLFFSV